MIIFYRDRDRYFGFTNEGKAFAASKCGKNLACPAYKWRGAFGRIPLLHLCETTQFGVSKVSPIWGTFYPIKFPFVW